MIIIFFMICQFQFQNLRQKNLKTENNQQDQRV